MNASLNNVLKVGAKSDAQKNKPIDVSKVQPKLFKKDKPYKSLSDRVLDWMARGLATMLVTGAILFTSVFMNLGAAPLPNTGDVYKNLDTLGIGTEIVTKMDSGDISRFIIKDGAPIKVGVSDEFTPEEKQVIQECIDKYNKVFEVINPSYKFVIDDESTLLEQMHPDYIMVKPTGKLDGNAVAFEHSGFFPTKNGYDTIHNSVHMGEASRENLNMFRNTFLHEFMHALGVADAYLVKDFYEGTIMNCTASYTKTNDLYKYDVALLAALYGDFSNQENAEKMINFINNYGANSTYTDTSYCKYRKTNLNKKVNKPADEDGMTF